MQITSVLDLETSMTNGSRSENNLKILSSQADEVRRKSVLLSNGHCKEFI